MRYNKNDLHQLVSVVNNIMANMIRYKELILVIACAAVLLNLALNVYLWATTMIMKLAAGAAFVYVCMNCNPIKMFPSMNSSFFTNNSTKAMISSVVPRSFPQNLIKFSTPPIEVLNNFVKKLFSPKP